MLYDIHITKKYLLLKETNNLLQYIKLNNKCHKYFLNI